MKIVYCAPNIIAIAFILAGFATPTATATAQVITEFPLPSGSRPSSIAAGPDGNLWFADFSGYIGRTTPAGVTTMFSQGLHTGSRPRCIALGSDGNLWFTDDSSNNTSAIGRITPEGVITEFPLENLSIPIGLAAGPDGNLWFTDNTFPPAIGRINPTTQAIAEFTQGLHAGSGEEEIAAGPDGNLWFIDDGVGRGVPLTIDRITPAGVITEFALNPSVNPAGLIAAPDGNIWFSDAGTTPALARLDPATGAITEFSNGLSPISPSHLTAGADGALWFGAYNRTTQTAAIGRSTLTGSFSDFSAGLNPLGEPGGLTAGPDGNIWFVEENSTAPAIGRITVPANSGIVLAAAVLPGSRSVEVGNNATIFATMINAGTSALGNCRISLTPPAPPGLALSFQATSAATNEPIGTPDTPVSLPGDDGLQSFILSFQGTAAFSAPNLPIEFGCDGTPPAAVIPGVDTVALNFSTTPTPDIIAIAVAAGGVLTIPQSTNSSGAFATATANAGSAGTITVTADTGGASLPLTATLCPTNPATAACLSPPAASAQVVYQPNSTQTYSVFATASAPIAFAPGTSRVFLRFTDGTGSVRGSTSVAVQTN